MHNSAFICLQSNFQFQHGKKLWTHTLFSRFFCHYRNHTNNDNKIYLLWSSACFQQNFHDWFSLLGYSSDLGNLNENHYCLTSTKSVICQVAPNCSPFQLLNMLSFHVRLECLKLSQFNINYFKKSLKNQHNILGHTTIEIKIKMMNQTNAFSCDFRSKIKTKRVNEVTLIFQHLSMPSMERNGSLY